MATRASKIMSLLKLDDAANEELNVSWVSSRENSYLNSSRENSQSFCSGYVEVDRCTLRDGSQKKMICEQQQNTFSSADEEQFSYSTIEEVQSKCDLQIESDKDDDLKDPDYEVNSSSEDSVEGLGSTNKKNVYCQINIAKNQRTSGCKVVQQMNGENRFLTSKCNNELDLGSITESKEKLSSKEEVTVDNFKVDVNHAFLHVTSSKGETKRHFCVFCKTLHTKFARHLEHKHKEEQEVKLLLSLPKKSSQRSHLISQLRSRGDFLYNSDANHNKGDIILVRRPQPQKQRQAKHYLPCGSCGSMYSTLSLYIHYKKCAKNRDIFKKDILCASRARAYVNSKANSTMKTKILPPMRNDEINRLIRNEDLIILFGNRLTQKYRSPHLHKMIRARLRCVGKFYLIFKKKNPHISNFENVFDPTNYDNVVLAINEMAGLNEETGKYAAPATASNICSYMKKLSLYLISETIKRKNKVKLEEVRNFLQLLEEGFQYDVYKTVLENQLEMKRHKVVNLPLTEDIALLKKYLDDFNRHHYMKLKNKFFKMHWEELSKGVLISLQLFNRRRSGEIERIKIGDFLQYESVNVDDEMAGNLEIKNSDYVRFLIRGKLGRGVPVLVSKLNLNYLKLILKYRSMAGVPQTNPYVFGTKGMNGMKHLEANRLMTHFANNCGAKYPERLKGTELRKHFATKCGSMDLNGVDIKEVADYMGHHKEIHLEHYRLPNATRDIMRMSHLLEKAQTAESISASIEKTDNSNISLEESSLNELTYKSLNNTEDYLKEVESTCSPQKKKRTRLSWTN